MEDGALYSNFSMGSFQPAPSRKTRILASEQLVEEEELSLAYGKAYQLPFVIQGYIKLKVLMLKTNTISSKYLEIVADNCPLLLKIDASDGEITTLPNVFHKMSSLTCALFHRNDIKDWTSVSNLLQAPSLRVVALYMNPVASPIDYRTTMLRLAPQLELIDSSIVCDDERLIAMNPWYYSRDTTEDGNDGGYVAPRFISTLFSALCARSAMMMSTSAAPCDYEEDEPVDSELSLYKKDMEYLKAQRPKCSAATFIQRWFRNRGLLLLSNISRRRMLKGVLTTQRWWRGVLLRKRALDALRTYLIDSCEEDLLLSAEEQMRVRAIKFIQANVRAWVLRREWHFRMHRSGLVLSRILKGNWVRNNLLRSRLGIKEYPYIYFPAKIAWEMLVALNTVRLRNRLPVFTMESAPFHLANVMAIRFPLPTEDMDTCPTTLATLVRASESTVVRPMHQHRFDHPWDGPLHRVCGFLSPAQCNAMRIIPRQGRVNNYARKLFHASCDSGQHVVGRGAFAPWKDIWCPEVGRAIAQLKTCAADAMDTDTRDYLEMARYMGGKRLTMRPDLQSVSTRGMPGFLGTKCFAQTAWLNQPMLKFRLDGNKLIADTVRFIRCVNAGLATMRLRPLMIVVEKDIRHISAAVVIQSTWRAQKARKKCGGSIALAILIQRATVKIQRWFRWLPLMKRMALLQTGFRYIGQINTPMLYMEERMFFALNLINSARRSPDFMKRVINFGISLMPEGIVVVPHLKDHGRRTTVPDWFMKGLDLQIPEEVETRVISDAAHIFGLQDMLVRNLVEPPNEKNVLCVARGVFGSLFDVDVPPEYDNGDLRFRLLRFRTTEDARHMAFAVYFCTYVVYRGLFAKLLPHSCLRDMKTADASSQIRTVFDLNWPAADRAVQFRINRQFASSTAQTVPLHGQRLDLLHISSMARPDEEADATKQATHATANELTSGLGKEKLAKNRKSSSKSMRNRMQNHKKAQLKRLKDVDENDFFTGSDDHPDGTRVVMTIRGTVPLVTEAISGTAQTSSVARAFRAEKKAQQRVVTKKNEEDLLKRKMNVQSRRNQVAGVSQKMVLRSAKEYAVFCTLRRFSVLQGESGYERGSEHDTETIVRKEEFNKEQLNLVSQWTPRPDQRPTLDDEEGNHLDLTAMDDALTTLSLSPVAARGINHTPVFSYFTRSDTAPLPSASQTWHHPCEENLEVKRQRIEAWRLYRAHRRAETVLGAQFAAGENESVRKVEEEILMEDIADGDQRGSDVAELRQRTLAFRAEKQQRAKRRAFHARFAAARCVLSTTCKRVDVATKRTIDLSEAHARVLQMNEEAHHAKLRGAFAAQEEKDRCASETRHRKKMNAYIRMLQRIESERAMAEKKKRIRGQREVRLLLQTAKDDLYAQEKKMLNAVEFQEYEDALRKFKELSANVKRKTMLAGEQNVDENADQSVARAKFQDWSDEWRDEDAGLPNFPIATAIENLFNVTPKADKHAPAPAHTPVDLRTSDTSEDCAQPSGGAERLITPRQSRLSGLSEGVSKEELPPADCMPGLIPTAPPSLPPLKNVPISMRDCSPTLEQNHDLPAWSRPMTRVVMELKKLPSARLSSIRKIRQTGPFLSAR